MRLRVSQQVIVFALFVVLFVGFSLFLPGFFKAGNLLTLLQNVAILGILGLAMSIVVIGRGVDLSLVAALSVPPGLVLSMVEHGHPVPTALAAGLALALLFGLVNGWLVAYAEVPSLFATLASGLFLAGLGQVAFFQIDVVRWNPALNAIAGIELQTGNGDARELANGAAYAFGACAAGQGETWFCESWRRRIFRAGGPRAGTAVLDALPVYPSRITPASGGGFWLTAFAARTQLVEFVLRETAYRERMIKEIDPRYWIAPSLRSGATFLEPMQGAHIKTMGVVKPWAPPVSYGLVIRLSPEGEPVYSLHSRVGGRNHGVVAAVECGGKLYVLAKGAGRILCLPGSRLEAELCP